MKRLRFGTIIRILIIQQNARDVKGARVRRQNSSSASSALLTIKPWSVNAAASGVELTGKIEILLLCLPLIDEILVMADKMLSMGA